MSTGNEGQPQSQEVLTSVSSSSTLSSQNVQSGGDAGTAPENPSVAPTTGSERAIVSLLEEIIDEFRRGRRPKYDTAAEIVTVANTSTLPRDIVRDNTKSYLQLLDKVEAKAATRQRQARCKEETQTVFESDLGPLNSAGRGEGFTTEGRPEGGSFPGGGGESHPQCLSPGPPLKSESTGRFADSLVEAVRRESSGRGNSLKRRESDSTGSESSNSSETSDEDDGPSRKHRRIDERKLPWYEHEKLARENEDPRCTRNRTLLRRYLRNITEVKRSILTSLTAPADFPSSEWDKLLRGEEVCFDTLYSAVGHLGAPREIRGRLGNREFIFGYSSPLRKVETSGQWLVAASIYAKGLKFAFPDRENEFQSHINHILSLFAARHESAHGKVIAYDKAVRARVGGGTRLLLTDRHEFADIRDSMLEVDGIYFSGEKTPSSGASKPGANSRVKSSNLSVCRRWNTAKGCPFDANVCYYQHVCKTCRGTHTKLECNENSKD